jgi:small-conductance mechanosensitive channel
MLEFIAGDRVKIGDVTGDVIEKTLLVTRLRTIKNEEITIPNAAILAGSTINYSTLDDEIELILNTSVTIGYDIPWRKVNELLMKAATKTEFVNSNPAPFLLQTSLDDFYVSYQLNAYTNYANKAATIYSAIHANIQDLFNENGVEIMSPHYKANRDGNHVTILNEY